MRPALRDDEGSAIVEFVFVAIVILQPFLGLTLAAALLHKPISRSMVAVSLLVVACVAGAKRFAGPSARDRARAFLPSQPRGGDTLEPSR